MKETVLANTALFAGLTGEQRSLIAERMAVETRQAGDLICSHGRPAATMYVLSSGWARLMSEQLTVLANVGPGSVLGEADVLLGRPYTLTAEAATDVTLLALSAADLADITNQRPEIGRQLRIIAGATDDMDKIRHLRRLNLMAGLGTEQLREVAQHLRVEKFSAGQGIYCRGTFGNALYLIDQGQVSVQRPGQPPTVVGSGDIFGISALLEDEPHSNEASALTDVQGWSLSREDFEKLALRYPILALNLTRLLSQRLRQINEGAVAPMAAAPVVAVAPTGQPARSPVAVGQPARTPAAPMPMPAVAPVVARVERPASQATGWFRSRSTGAKIRLIAVVVLLVWLIGVAAPLTIINLLSQSLPAPAPQPVRTTARTLQERVVLVALAADLPVQFTPTYTPWPTETPLPTPTFTPTPTPTNTPIPTPTFTPTATPIPPTATPIPPPIVRAAPAAAAAAEPPKPTTQFSVVEKRRLTACENKGKHNIFIKVVDGGGNPIDGVILVQTPHGQTGNVLDKTVSGTKGPGLAEFTLWKGATYDVYITEDGVNPANTEIAQELHSNFPDESNCPDGGGGNTLFHNSFNVIFRKNF